MAIRVEDGGEGDEVDPGAENGEVLPFSSLVTMSSWPSLLETLLVEVEVATEAVADAGEVSLLFATLSNSISRICSWRISSLESGIKYFRTYKHYISSVGVSAFFPTCFFSSLVFFLCFFPHLLISPSHYRIR